MSTSTVKSVKELLNEVNKLSRTILLSSNKTDITKAFKRLMCLLTGQCVCDICKTWDTNVFLLFEFGRCLVPPRFMQLVKERHYNTKRWNYVLPLYMELFNTIYEDISPDTEVIHSSGDMEDQACMYSLSDKLKKQAINLIKTERPQ